MGRKRPNEQADGGGGADPLAELDAMLFGASVAREPHPSMIPGEELLGQCEFRRSKGGGPGGQRRNKVETHAELFHRPTGHTAQAGERRNLEENKRVALRRLRLVLATKHRVEVPAGEVRSEVWRARTKTGKIVLSVRHADHPAMLAEAMDMIAACSWDVSKAARRLTVSSSQLGKLVQSHPPAWELMNSERSKRGLRPLKQG